MLSAHTDAASLKQPAPHRIMQSCSLQTRIMSLPAHCCGPLLTCQVVEGLYGDAATQHATIARFYHPDAKLVGPAGVLLPQCLPASPQQLPTRSCHS
jgi:hypothetical protein